MTHSGGINFFLEVAGGGEAVARKIEKCVNIQKVSAKVDVFFFFGKFILSLGASLLRHSLCSGTNPFRLTDESAESL